MIQLPSPRRQKIFALALTVSCLLMAASEARAGGLLRRRTHEVVPTVQVTSVAPSSTLGTFYPTPYVTVRGNFPAGGGYTPLGQFGDGTFSLYGPFSTLRSTSAPVHFYASGYDGRPVVARGTSFSTPNLPPLSPVIYPTRASYFYGFRTTTIPPWWTSGFNWVDQN